MANISISKRDLALLVSAAGLAVVLLGLIGGFIYNVLNDPKLLGIGIAILVIGAVFAGLIVYILYLYKKATGSIQINKPDIGPQ